MKERGILSKEVEEAIKNPDQIGKRNEKNLAIKSRKNGHILLIYYIDNNDTIRVITVISTSKTTKYLE